MKKTTLLLLFLTALTALTACKKEPSFTVHFTTRNYYISIADSIKSNRSAEIINALENDINNTEYVLTTIENDWQGIVKVDGSLDMEGLKDRAVAEELHRFTIDNTNSKRDTMAFKIELTLLKPVDGNNFRFGMGVYRTDKKSEWQRHFSPGLFVYKESDTTPKAIAEWAKRLTVTASFK